MNEPILPQDALLALHAETCGKALQMIKAKSADYAGANSNSLATLRMAASFGVHPVIGVLLRVTDKLQRVSSFVSKGQLQVKGESVDDAIEDIINYMVLIKGLIAEDKLKEDAKPKP